MDKNINLFSLKLLKQTRSLRGSLTMKARDAIFATYGKLNLLSIKTNTSSLKISNWKKSPEVNASYKKLFRRTKDNNNLPLTISFIIERVFWEKEYTNVEL